MKVALGPISNSKRLIHSQIEQEIVSDLKLGEAEQKQFAVMVYADGGILASLKLSDEIAPELAEKIKASFEKSCAPQVVAPVIPPVVPPKDPSLAGVV